MFKLFKLASNKTKILAVFAFIFVALQGVFEGTQILGLTMVVSTLQEATVVENTFWIASWIILINALLALVSGGIGAWFGVKCSTQLGEAVRHNIFYKSSKLSFGDIEKLTISSILTRITSDVQNVQTSIQLGLTLFIKTPVLIIYGIAINFIANWMFGLIYVAVMILVIITMVIITRAIASKFYNIQPEVDNSNKIVRENVLGIKTIKSYGLENEQLKRFEKSNEIIMKHNTKAWSITGIIIPLVNSFVYVGIGCFLLVAGKAIIAGKFTSEVAIISATVFQFISLLIITLSSIIMSGVSIISYLKSKPSFERINEFIDLKPAVKNAYKSKRIDKRNLNIEFKDVNFKYYDEANTNILSNISIKINQGEMVGIIGQTGSGKTSLVSLICRLYEIKDGKLIIGVNPIKKVNLKSLNREIGLVLQDDTLFSGTIRDNLLIGNPKATDKQLMHAARIACADRFINARKEGLDSIVEQRGNNFSTGQQQRLSIARTMAKQPNILILDDSTSSLDVLTEAKVHKNIRWNMRHGTTIITTQRVSTVKNCDRIIVMDQGKIVGYGTHDSLKLSNEMYRSLILTQMGEEGIR